MPTTSMLTLGAVLTMKDGSTISASEGSVMRGLKYDDETGRHTVDGSLRVLVANSKVYNEGPTSCPPESFVDQIISVTDIILDISTEWNAKLVRIPVDKIVTVTTVDNKSPIPSTDKFVDPSDPDIPSFTEVMTTISDGATITISDGEITASLALDKSVTLSGVNANIAQNFKQEVI